MEETPQPRAVAVIRCKDTGKKLARRNERGIFLFCKECGYEEFFSWEETLPEQMLPEAQTDRKRDEATSSEQSNGAADYLREFQDVAVVQHMQGALTAQGRAMNDVTEVLFRELIYEGKPNGDWETCERSHIGFYDLTFADKTTIHQYWHFGRNAPLTYEQAKAELDKDRLTLIDRSFFLEDH